MKKTSEAERPDKPLIIPIFIMNAGCPQHCVFCNEKIAAGSYPAAVSRRLFEREVDSYLRWNKDKRRRVEIAFYGGNFTGLPQDDQNRLLSWANVYMAKGAVESIRISTRPDYIVRDQLEYLYGQGVRTVEVGAQSFSDEVLRHAGRGHNAQAIERALPLLKAHGFKTGLHLMAGLPGETKESFLQGLCRTVEIRPDTARIHPVLVFKDTPLADEYLRGRYQPLDLAEAVDWCRLAWEKLTPAGIRIIRFGLQMTSEMGQPDNVLAGPLHPSLGSLVYSAIFFQAALQLISEHAGEDRRWRFQVAARDMAHFRGPGNANIQAIKKLYPDAEISIESIRKDLSGQLSIFTESGKSLVCDMPEIS